MRRLLSLLLALTAPLAAQTINVNQIRPSNTPGQVITTPVANQPPVWATPANSILLEHNGTSLALQNLLNFNDSIPAAPSGFTDVLWQSDGSGNLSAYLPSVSNSLQMQVVPPVAGQYVIIYPTHSTSTSSGNVNALTGNTYGDFIASPYCTFPGSASATWSGFSLPSYVNAANVTAVYAFAISGNYTSSATINCGISPTFANVNAVAIGATGGSSPNLVNTDTLYGLGQSTAQMVGLSGANIPTATIGAGASNGGDFKTQAETVVALMGLIVYYTGTPPPATAGINVDPPLTYFNNNLSISPEAVFNGKSLLATDTYHLVIPAKGLELINNGASSTDCSTGGGTSLVLCYWNGTGWSNFSSGGGGGSGVSSINSTSGAFTFNFSSGAGSCSGTTCTFNGGGTGGLPCVGTCTGSYVPLFGSGGTSLANSHIDDGVTTANKVTSSEEFDINCTGSSCPSQVGVTYNSAAAPTVGSSTTAVYAVNSSGQAVASEAGAAFSRVCTAANGICTGGGGGTSNPTTCTVSSATNICITDSTYNGSGAGATTTTTSATFGVGTSGSVTSCSTFLANEGVLITGAGTSGANYIGKVISCTGTTLTVAPTTATSVGSGVVVQHDETAAFNSAITALNPGGGTIWVPDGVYLVNGPLQDTSGANAILPMPKIPNYTSTLVDISIKGFTLPNWVNTTQGAVIKTAATTGNLFGGYDSAAGGPPNYPPFTNVKLDIENLALLAPVNPGIVMVNGTSILAVQAKHLLIGTGGTSLPTNTAGAAILMPAIANEVQNQIDDVNIGGYYTGISLTEHSQAQNLYASNGVNCIVLDNGSNVNTPAGYTGNSISIDYVWTQSCTNGMAGGSHITTANIQNADFELNTTDISDASNNLRGTVNFLNPFNSSNCTLNVSGAANIQRNPLYCASSVTQPLVSGVGGANSIGLTVAPAAVSGALPMNFLNLVGVQAMFGLNTFYNGTNFKYQSTGGAGAMRFLSYPGSKGAVEIATMPSGTAGSNVTGIGTTNLNELCTSDGQCWYNPGTETPTFPTNSVLVGNASANWFFDTSGNQTLHNLTVNGTCTGCTSAGIANITITLPTTAISANTCTTPATATMTGVLTSSVFDTAFATNPNAVTGWGAIGGLVVTTWPTANTLNWSVCNQTSASITPGAMTLNVGAR